MLATIWLEIVTKRFCTKFTVVDVYWPIIRELQLIWQNANIRSCTYPLLTLVQSLSPIQVISLRK